jgi:biotin-dependent carboxylase-like uncharacterized protein
LDAPAAALANRLVGNPVEAALLECSVASIALIPDRAVTVAVTGAWCVLEVDGRAHAFGEPVTVPAHQEIRLGRPDQGARTYVALAGGITVEPVLGSRSTDTLSGLGPPRVTSGSLLPLGAAYGAPRAADAPARRTDPRVIRVSLGPRADWFTPEAWSALGADYLVTPDSNRIGVRLSGPTLARARPIETELASEAMVWGGIQVPPDGQPVVLLADHPVTGGYPVIAVVDSSDLWKCAQVRPGDVVRFTVRGAQGP